MTFNTAEYSFVFLQPDVFHFQLCDLALKPVNASDDAVNLLALVLLVGVSREPLEFA